MTVDLGAIRYHLARIEGFSAGDIEWIAWHLEHSVRRAEAAQDRAKAAEPRIGPHRAIARLAGNLGALACYDHLTT